MSIRERRQLKYRNKSNQEQKSNVFNQTIIMHSPQFNINNAFLQDQNIPSTNINNNNINNNNINNNNSINNSLNYYQINQNANIENINNQNMMSTPHYKYDQQFSKNDSNSGSAQGKVYINRKLSHDKQFMNFFPPKGNNQPSINYEVNEQEYGVNGTACRQQQYGTISNSNSREYNTNTIQYNSLQPPSDNYNHLNTSKTKVKNSFRKASVKRPSINSSPLNYQPSPPAPAPSANGVVPLTKLIPQQPSNSSLDFQTTFVIPDNPQNLQHIFFSHNPELGSKSNLQKKSKERLDKNNQLIQIYGNRNTQKKSLNFIPVLNQSGQLQNYYIPQEQRMSKSTGRHHSVIRGRQRDESNQNNQINQSQTIQHQRNQPNTINNFRSISHERQSLYTNLRQQNSRGYFEQYRTGLQSSGERQRSNPRGIKYVQGAPPPQAQVYSLQNNQVYQINSLDNSASKLANKSNSQQPIQSLNQFNQQPSQPIRTKSFGRSRAYKFPPNQTEKETIKQQNSQEQQQQQQNKRPPQPIQIRHLENNEGEEQIKQNDSHENINYSSHQSDYLEKYIKNMLYQENMSTSNYDRLSSHMDKLSQKIYSQQSELKDFILQPIESAQNSDTLKQNDSSQINRFSFDQNYDPNRSFKDLPSDMEEKREEDSEKDKYEDDDFEKDDKVVEEQIDGKDVFTLSEQLKNSKTSKDNKKQVINNKNIYRQSQEVLEDSNLIRGENTNFAQYQSNYSSVNSFGCQNSYLGGGESTQDKQAYATINQDSQEFINDQLEVIEESFGSTFQNKISNISKRSNNKLDEIKLVDESIPKEQIQFKQKQSDYPHPPQLQKNALRTQGSLGGMQEYEGETTGQKKQRQIQQVTFCESPIIMEPKQEPLVVLEEKKFKRNAAKIYKRNDLLNKNTLKDSHDQIDIEKVQKMKLNLQFQVGDKKTLIPRQPADVKKDNKANQQVDKNVVGNRDMQLEIDKLSIDDQGSDLNPVDELSTYKEEKNLLDDNEEVDSFKKSILNTQFDQMIATSLNNYLNKTETNQDLKTKSDGYFSHFDN